jgi:hypothetical protein
MLFYLIRDEPLFSPANEPAVSEGKFKYSTKSLQLAPLDTVFGFLAQVDVIRYQEVMLPINNFLVSLVCRLRAERRVSNETFEHDRTKRPPIAFLTVTFHHENFGCDIVGGSDSGVCLRGIHK